jgi:5-methylthioadenosine/S-adenosylhomocysteine deaminase
MMPGENIDPLVGPKYVLQGRLVTMGPQGVVPEGAIYIDAGTIKAVLPASQDPPAGFEDAPRIRTGDTIYPGLIELHNHLCYNAMPLWDVPQRYSNNGQWKNHEDYRRLITKPSQVLGRTPGVVEALVRFVECRSLLGGVTTSQGITLSSAPGIRSYYHGIVRNVEQTDDPALPQAGTRIANPDTTTSAGRPVSSSTSARGWMTRRAVGSCGCSLKTAIGH